MNYKEDIDKVLWEPERWSSLLCSEVGVQRGQR